MGKIKVCPVGTLVSYATVDGTCRKVANYKHQWCKDGTCGNCDMSREEAGYSVTQKELKKRIEVAERRQYLFKDNKSTAPSLKA